MTLLDAVTTARLERMVREQICRLWETTTTTDETTERVTEIFDTTQPTDSATGTPPLLSRTTEKREARKMSESREQRESTAAGTEAQTQFAAANHTKVSASETSAESRRENETKGKEEKRSGNIASWIVFPTMMLLLIAGIGSVFIKKRLNNL